MSDSDAKRALQSVISSLNKKYKEDVFIDNSIRKSYEVVSTGSAILDEDTGIGGLAIGKCYEVAGQFSSGKSSLCSSIVAQFQKAYPNKVVVYLDIEQALNVTYISKFGVDVEALKISSPSSAEQALDTVLALVKTGAVSLIVYDSVPAAPTVAQIEKGMDGATMGALALALSKAMAFINPVLAPTKTTLLFVNQVRASLNMYGAPTVNPGGNAIPFYSSIRLGLTKKELIVDPVTKDIIGQEIEVKFVKNKLGTPYKVSRTTLLFGKGFDFETEYVIIAEKYNVLQKGGAWYSFLNSKGDTVKFQGAAKVAAFFKENPEEFKFIQEQVEVQKELRTATVEDLTDDSGNDASEAIDNILS